MWKSKLIYDTSLVYDTLVISSWNIPHEGRFALKYLKFHLGSFKLKISQPNFKKRAVKRFILNAE